MRPLLAAALVGLATFGAYSLLVRPETAAFMEGLAASGQAETDLGIAVQPPPETVGVFEAAGGVGQPEATPSRGAVNTTIGEINYAVSGGSEREVLESLRAGGPKSEGSAFFGLTVTELEYRYYKVTENGACRIEDVVVDLNVEITLPEWSGSRAADAELRSAWSRFSTALRRHENMHRDLAVQGAEGVREALEGLRTRSCATADEEAQQAAERVRIETEAAHRDFDHQTEHGRTQGAVWPQP